jgi:hypothetical protein
MGCRRSASSPHGIEPPSLLVPRCTVHRLGAPCPLGPAFHPGKGGADRASGPLAADRRALGAGSAPEHRRSWPSGPLEVPEPVRRGGSIRLGKPEGLTARQPPSVQELPHRDRHNNVLGRRGNRVWCVRLRNRARLIRVIKPTFPHSIRHRPRHSNPHCARQRTRWGCSPCVGCTGRAPARDAVPHCPWAVGRVVSGLQSASSDQWVES